MKNAICYILITGSVITAMVADNLLFLLITVGVIIYYFIDQDTQKYNLKKSTEEFARKEFVNSKIGIKQRYIGADHLSAIGISENENKIVTLTRKSTDENFNHRVIKFDELIEVKLIKDDEIVSNVSRASQLGGALIGGVIAGGFGAVVGAMGASQTSHSETSKLAIELVVDDIDKPIENIVFLKEVIPLKSYEKKFKEAYENANNWYRMLGVVLNRNRQENKVSL